MVEYDAMELIQDSLFLQSSYIYSLLIFFWSNQNDPVCTVAKEKKKVFKFMGHLSD